MAASGDHGEGDAYVQRVSQLDAVDLDGELHSLLKEQVFKAFKYIKPRYWSAVEPEFDFLLSFVILAISMRSHHATVGQQLLNIKYRDSAHPGNPSGRKLTIFVLVIVVAHWMKSREAHLALSLNRWPTYQTLARKGFHLTEITVRLLMLINSMWFLVEGRYSLIIERLLRLTPVYASPQDVRQVSYEYLNRELLWHGFAEFFNFLMPMFNVRRLVNVLCRWVPVLHLEEPTMPSQRTRDNFLECAVCEQSPTLPHDIGCSHVFCYYCIVSNVNTDPNYRCPKCGLQVKLEDPINVVTVR